jgi:hypothetical protein
MIRAKEKEPLLLFYYMDPTVWSAIIAASAAVIVNIISNVVLSAKQTAVIEIRIKQLEDTLSEIKKLPDRVTRLETKMSAAEDAIREMRLS